MRNVVIAVAALLVLGGCGGSSGSTSAAELAKRVGCPDAQVTTKLQPNEPQRDERADCHGLTIVTFANSDDRDAYVAVSKAANQAFGQPLAVQTGDTWAVMGTPAKVSAVKNDL